MNDLTPHTMMTYCEDVKRRRRDREKTWCIRGIIQVQLYVIVTVVGRYYNITVPYSLYRLYYAVASGYIA